MEIFNVVSYVVFQNIKQFMAFLLMRYIYIHIYALHPDCLSLTKCFIIESNKKKKNNRTILLVIVWTKLDLVILEILTAIWLQYVLSTQSLRASHSSHLRSSNQPPPYKHYIMKTILLLPLWQLRNHGRDFIWKCIILK